MSAGTKWPRHEWRVLLTVVFSGGPGVVVALWLLGASNGRLKAAWLLGVVIVGVWVGGSWVVKTTVSRPLQTVSSLLGALREGDLSIRGRGARRGDRLGEVLFEINLLADTLARQRSGELEATALLAKVMSEIDVAVFAFDERRALRLINRAGERLLGKPGSDIVGRDAAQLGLAKLLEGDAPRTIGEAFAGAEGTWEVRRGTFRQQGLPHELVVLTDVKRALREEERLAWQRIVRVLGHEINSSLTPIVSIANELGKTFERADRPLTWEADMIRGLSVIERRSEALCRFMASYARLAKLPPPKLGRVDVGTWVRRVVDIEKRIPVRVAGGPSAAVLGDGDQLDQLLINLIQNGVDAAAETGGSVEVAWRKVNRELEVIVTDEGPGLAATQNLFVPFFTTKATGSGIGLVLSRQIAEAHRGVLTLENRAGRRGCQARLRLPL